MPRKYIFISGGVISGLGKGIITSSLSLLLKDQGYKVSPVKIDMYLNMDAGTLRPQEHGETFVLDSGLETDQDLGNYERFLGESLPRENYMTTGQIYAEVLRKERAFEYEGEDVEAIPHVTDEIIRRIKLSGDIAKADVVLIELGGTITLQEVQNRVFIEASRIMKLKNPGDVTHIHVTYLPFIRSVGELKAKPAYTSVYILNSMGIQPDFVFARSEVPLDQRREDKVALFCNTLPEDLILCPDVPVVYSVPDALDNQKTAQKICVKLGLKSRKGNGILSAWRKTVKKIVEAPRVIKIAIAGKYYKTGGSSGLSDAYVSVVESLKHAGGSLGVKVDILWINPDEMADKTQSQLQDIFAGVSGIIVPQGWGSRGVEGKIATVKYAREHKIPYLGLCFGMQMATIEFARHVLGWKGANTEEANPRTGFPVIHIMPDQAAYLAAHQYGGTIRLGGWPCLIKPGTKLEQAYLKYGPDPNSPWYSSVLCESKSPGLKTTVGKMMVFERHRHRYEFNNQFKVEFEKAGFVISGTSPDGKLVEAIELPEHPFFVGTQFHPEYISRPLTPHPLFVAFLAAASK